MQIDGNNNIQVNGNISLNVSGELPVSKKTLKKLIRKEIERALFKKICLLVRSDLLKKSMSLCSSHNVVVQKEHQETLLQCFLALEELFKKITLKMSRLVNVNFYSDQGKWYAN